MKEKKSKRLLLDWDYPQPFTKSITVKPEHIDGLNHVNNTVYMNWCEDAGWSHNNAIGLNLGEYQKLDRAMAIRRSKIEYLQASYLGDELQVATWLTNTDQRLTLKRYFQVIRERDGVTLLRAQWDLVCIELSSGRPKRMPTEFKSIYGDAVNRLKDLA